MISIIICSRLKSDNHELLENIKSTIGCEYELIVIDNSENKYSIFQAYNIGIETAEYPYLVFIHEDILFHTFGWGSVLIAQFLDHPKAGLIGVAGSKIKTKMPSAWWENDSKFLVKNILQHYPNMKPKQETFGFSDKNEEEVVTIDGVFMAIRKNDDIQLRGDLKGFHNYDQSLSLDVRELGYKVLVTNRILIEHFSTGKINDAWVRSTLQFQELYKDMLPQRINGEVTRDHEAKSCLSFIYNCRYTGHKRTSFKFWLKYFTLKPFSYENHLLLKYYLTSPYTYK